MSGQKNIEKSLCWLCDKACKGGCSWADNFTMVDGVKAEYNAAQKTWSVRECPLYEPDRPMRDINEKGAMLLMQRVLEVAREDYILMPRQRKEIENWIRERGAVLCMFDDPEGVIQRLRSDALKYSKTRASRIMIRGGR